METVGVKLSLELLRAANLDESSFSEETARVLALELHREDKVSLGRAAELCQTPLAACMDFATNFEDLKEECQTANRLKA